MAGSDRPDRQPKRIDAVRLVSGRQAEGQASYRIIAETSPDRRRAARRTVHLRSGRLAGSDGRFLADCRLHDVGGGVGLRLSVDAVLPERVWLLDEREGYLGEARFAWRNGDAAGLSFTGRRRRTPAALIGPLYAVAR